MHVASLLGFSSLSKDEQNSDSVQPDFKDNTDMAEILMKMLLRNLTFSTVSLMPNYIRFVIMRATCNFIG
jgi:hypothetical protein